eukprot:gene800-4088_t
MAVTLERTRKIVSLSFQPTLFLRCPTPLPIADKDRCHQPPNIYCLIFNTNIFSLTPHPPSTNDLDYFSTNFSLQPGLPLRWPSTNIVKLSIFHLQSSIHYLLPATTYFP